MDAIIDLAKKLIGIHSTSDNQEGLNEITSLAENYLSNFTVQRFHSNGIPSLLVHNAKPQTKLFNLILNGHLDIVPGNKEQFKAIIKGNKLYGRGSYDMKSAAAVNIYLFKELANNLDYPIALQLVTDEEIGGYNGTKFQVEKGITADFVIAGENTDSKIINKFKGPLWLKIRTKGKTAHGAYPWKGENALLIMYAILQKIQTLYPIPQNNYWQTTVNVAKIETQNTTFNKVPADCVAWLDIRVIPGEENDILQKIKKLLPNDTELEIVLQEKPAYTDPSNPYIKQLQESNKKISSHEAEIAGIHGSSDVRFYNTLRNIPGVDFGPIGAGAHSDEEWVDLKSLENYYQILKQFLLTSK